MHAVVAEIFTHRDARIGREILKGRGFRSGRGDDDRIFHRAIFFERADDLRDGRALLPNRDVDAVELLALVPRLVGVLLVDERVERHGRLAGLTIANDQLALAAANRDERVERLETGLDRLMNRLARDDSRRLQLDPAAFRGFDRALAVDRVAERVDDTAEQALADRHIDDRAGTADGRAFGNFGVRAEDHDADIVGFEVEGHAFDAVVELDHFSGLDIVETIDAGDAVADRQDGADLRDFGLGIEIRDLVADHAGDFCGADIHGFSLAFHRLSEPIEFSADGCVDALATELDDDPAEDLRIDLGFEIDVATGSTAQLLLEGSDLIVVERTRGDDLGARLAAMVGGETPIGADHGA